MSNTPDLDRAREAASAIFEEFSATKKLDSEQIARLILEQRAEEAERCAKTHSCFDVGWYSYLARAASLRSQIGGKP